MTIKNNAAIENLKRRLQGSPWVTQLPRISKEDQGKCKDVTMGNSHRQRKIYIFNTKAKVEANASSSKDCISVRDIATRKKYVDWQLRCNCMAAAWQMSGSCISTAWQLHCLAESKRQRQSQSPKAKGCKWHPAESDLHTRRCGGCRCTLHLLQVLPQWLS